MQELHDLSGLSVAEKNALILALFERGKASIAQAVRTLAPEPKRVALAVSASPVVHFDEAAERVGTHSSFLRVFTSASAMLICAFLSVGDTRAQVIVPDPGAAPRGLVPAPPAPAIAPAPASGRVVSMEVGASAGHATIEPPGMNSEFGTLTVTQPGDWSATGLLGRSERFGDQSVDFGGSFTKTLPRDVDATVGLSSGTGEFISQRYRFDASLRTPILLSDKSLVATGGFRRMQSKGENFSNGLNAGLAWYVDGHWLLGAGVEADRGYPGDTISKLYLASVTRYEYKRWYIGATVRQGHAAYTQIGPSLTLVDYRTRSYTVSGSWWWSKRDALSVNADYVDNSFYTVSNLNLRWFREFP